MNQPKAVATIYAVYREEYPNADPLSDDNLREVFARAIDYIPVKTFTDAVRVALTKVVPQESIDERMNER